MYLTSHDLAIESDTTFVLLLS